MSDYQGLHKKNVQSETREEEQSRTQDGKSCPSCGAPNPPEALFCSECGASLEAPAFCPSCGAKTNPGADICASCGAWLLEGRCTFCYAPLPRDAAFCPECGNGRNGIVCPSCGRLSIFDFCSACSIPLTEGAKAAVEAAKNDPAASAVVEAMREAQSIDGELAEIERELESVPLAEEAPSAPKARPKPSFFSAAHSAEILGSKAVIENAERAKEESLRREAEAEAESARRAEASRVAELKAKKAALEAKRVEAEKAANAAMMKFKNKKFATQQEARRYHMAMKPAHVSGWLCNFTNTVHPCPEGPNDCDQPQLGGCWYSGDTMNVKVSGPS